MEWVASGATRRLRREGQGTRGDRKNGKARRGEEERGGEDRIGGSSIQGEREGLMAQAGHTAAINRRTARNYRLATCEI